MIGSGGSCASGCRVEARIGAGRRPFFSVSGVVSYCELGTGGAVAAQPATVSPRPPCHVEPLAPRVLVLGLGNAILSDDAIGLHVARALRLQIGPEEAIAAVEVEEMGLSLLDYIVGCRDLVIVDSIQTGRVPPGCLHEIDGDDSLTRRGGSPHFLGVGETIACGRLLGLAMPERIRIFAVEVNDPFTLGESLTPPVAAALNNVADRVLAAARSFANG